MNMPSSKDEIEQIRRSIGLASWEIQQCLAALNRLENEAFSESGFNEAANTGLDDPEELKATLEIIADEAVSAARTISTRLVEVKLELDAAMVTLRSFVDGGEA